MRMRVGVGTAGGSDLRGAAPLRRALGLFVLAGLLGGCASAPAGGGDTAAPGRAGTGPDTLVQAGAVPSPASYLGFEVGSDRRLADWNEVTGYMAALAQASPRVRVDTLGETTLGRPFIMLTISSEANLSRLDRYRDINQRLADPRRIQSPGQAENLLSEGRAIVLITASIHSTEVGGTQMTMKMAYRLASSNGAEERKILDNVILLLVPSLNPDGEDLVVNWYESTLGTAWEGASPPFLYHHYVGHDNNRDWYFFTQKETNLTIEGAHNAWRPQIVHDIHQMGSTGARIFMPPWIDPVEPNVDPLLIESANDLGTHMAWQLGVEGKKGVAVAATYDAWTPARAYQHYHAGVRILSETASARMATPIEVPFEELRQQRGFHAQERSWNFMEPWPGGTWRLSDIVSYMEAGAFALLDHAAENREVWLRSFLNIGRRAVNHWDRWPAAWIIPAEQENRIGLQELLRVLATADVEVRPSRQAFSAGGRDYPPGTYVILMRQPYAAFAQTMLERQDYPDLRLYPGGPPRPPYDVTAHTLPLLLDVDAVATSAAPPATVLGQPIEAPRVERVAPGLTRGTPGADTAPRVGLYQSWSPSMDEGWTRWIFDQYDIAYTTIHDADVRAGRLGDRFDVVVLPQQSPRRIIEGREPGTIDPRYVGGLGDEGVAALRSFVEGGGTLVALDEASTFAIQYLDLPVRNVVDGLAQQDFYIPGSILRIVLDPASRLADGMPERTIAWYERNSMAFEADDPSVRFAARYGAEPLLSGWALGQDRIAGKGAIADVSVGQGRVVLFGFRPQYRGQPVATFPLFFNALK